MVQVDKDTVMLATGQGKLFNKQNTVCHQLKQGYNNCVDSVMVARIVQVYYCGNALVYFFSLPLGKITGYTRLPRFEGGQPV